LAEAVFWGALAIVCYVYAGYPLLIHVLARLRPRPVRKGEHLPSLSFIVAAYNEEASIGAKIANTVALDYPSERFEIIVVSDGSSDRTEEIVRGFGDRVTLLALRGRNGKTSAQNQAVKAAKGEILVFSDATTVFQRDCLRALAANFADPEVGCVGGWVLMGVEQDAVVHKGRLAYADYEERVRRNESLFSSLLGTSGCAYALRRTLYTQLPADVISDVAQVMKVVEQGYRTVLEEEARVHEPGEGRSVREELDRRSRIITRGLRGYYYMRRFLNPLRHPWFFLQLLSHRLLRWAVPIFLIIAFAANLFLLDRPLYRWLLAAQLAFYLTAALGYVLERRQVRVRPLFLPLYFCVLNLAPLLAIRNLLRGEKKVVWETGR
jgi:cellulose synthase/poly-beta-1,6-N-acetylglucosamine synthase-like glycosyltransferase